MNPSRLSWVAVVVLALCGATIAFSQNDFWQQTENLKSGNVIALAKNTKQQIFAGTQDAGNYRVQWPVPEGINRWLPSGVYFYKFMAISGNGKEIFRTSGKLLLAR